MNKIVGFKAVSSAVADAVDGFDEKDLKVKLRKIGSAAKKEITGNITAQKDIYGKRFAARSKKSIKRNRHLLGKKMFRGVPKNIIIRSHSNNISIQIARRNHLKTGAPYNAVAFMQNHGIKKGYKKTPSREFFGVESKKLNKVIDEIFFSSTSSTQ